MPHISRVVYLAVGICALSAVCSAQRELPAGRTSLVLMHQQLERSAYVLIPRGAAPAGGRPLVVMLHGGGGSAEYLLGRSSWPRLSEREGFVLLLPNGSPEVAGQRSSFMGNKQTWNDGGPISLAPNTSAYARGVDDVGFLMMLIDHVKQRTPIDGDRVYLSGHSNGSAMSYRLAGEHPGEFAAVGVVAGHLRTPLPARSVPVPLLQITGAQDPFVPIAGGQAGFGRRRTQVPPAIHAPQQWAAFNGITTPETVVEDTALFRTVRWGTGGSRMEVMFTIIHGHGHEWPGDPSPLPAMLIGPNAHSMNACEVIWHFFESHRRPVPAGAGQPGAKLDEAAPVAVD